MTTFVLVHGAWGGAHGWRKVRSRLQAGGHQVFTPSLTGIGERAHLTGPHVDLSVHIDDVVNTVLYEDLDDIVLVGFSYGGMVVTGTLAHIAERVSHLVYLDAFVPANGQSADGIRGIAAVDPTPGRPWLVQPIPRDLDDPAETEWSNARRSPQPARTFSEPVRLPQELAAYPFSLTYIKALDDPDRGGQRSPFWAVADRVRGDDRWSYHEIGTNHMIPQNRPDDLIAILTAL